MKYIWIILALLFIVITLGILDVELTFTDGSIFRYRSWLHLFIDYE